MSTLVHGTAILVGTTGILIRGEPGSGKSSLALQALQAGGHLIADDRVFLSARSGRLIASVPTAIAGKMEIYGQGILKVSFEPFAIVRLIVDLAEVSVIERMPEPEEQCSTVLGIDLKRVILPQKSVLAAPLMIAAVQELTTSRS